MWRGFCILMVSVVATALAACETGPTGPGPEELTWAGGLIGEPGWEHLGGDVEVHWEAGTVSFTAIAEITGDEFDVVRPWHVHHNTCAEGGAIVGSDADYPRLIPAQDGRALATAEVPVPLDRTADFHANVHLSEGEMDVIIACADLELIVAA